MMSLEIQPQYLAEDDDASESMNGGAGGGSEEGEDGYMQVLEDGDVEIVGVNDTNLKKDKIFMPIDYTKRKTKIVCTLG